MELPVGVAENRTAIRRAMLAWFRRNARDLPWRQTRDPYRVWLSEIMLQQTRVDTVIAYYQRFLRAFPTVNALASARLDRVLKLWEGLGYYSRARHLHAAARLIVHHHEGRLPATAEAWARLPGIGRYTASAIASIAFGERVAVLDGNVKRVLARLFRIRRCIDDGATVELLWAMAESLVPPRAPGDFNQAMMELGATVCTPKRPRCQVCPVRAHCEARIAGDQETLPVRRKRRPIPHIVIVAGAVCRDGKYLMGKRPVESMLGGLWEFPGGKVEPGETHEAAVAREMKEETGLGVRVGRRLASVNHVYSHFSVTLHLYACRAVRGRPRAIYHSELRWMGPAQFRRYAFPAATLKLLACLPG
ncbi:MAG: A/G-specific adenine glycosylase [Phycisphaerae bacterium]|nr:A/G-specific adenine glycosylase [Phycisphaerae bacterium]